MDDPVDDGGSIRLYPDEVDNPDIIKALLADKNRRDIEAMIARFETGELTES